MESFLGVTKFVLDLRKSSEKQERDASILRKNNKNSPKFRPVMELSSVSQHCTHDPPLVSL